MEPSFSPRVLWLLRHAKTLTDPPEGGGDHDRALAPRGARDAAALGQRLGPTGDRLGLDGVVAPELVLSSDAQRTAQTTGLVFAPALSPPPLRFEPSLYGASPEEVLAALAGVDEDATSVMVVGHNPTAHELALGLGFSSEDRKPVERAGFPTCALAVFRFAVPHWHQVTEGSGTLVGLRMPPY